MDWPTPIASRSGPPKAMSISPPSFWGLEASRAGKRLPWKQGAEVRVARTAKRQPPSKHLDAACHGWEGWRVLKLWNGKRWQEDANRWRTRWAGSNNLRRHPSRGARVPPWGAGTKVRRAWSSLEAPLKPPWSPSQAPLKPPSSEPPSSPPEALLKPPKPPKGSFM